MIIEGPTTKREFKTETLHADLAVIGGGLAGTCCALTAARAGAKVVLIQDRPVLGGNASSEIRLWIAGATVHLRSNNRWAREGGLLDELLLENLHRNPEGNPLIFDTVLLEKVVEEPNLTLLLNTAAFNVEKANADTVASVRAFCSQNSTVYHVAAPLFCDASGDGVIGFLAGAAFRMGAEAKKEFGESFAPDASYGELLGHSLFFYSKDVGQPVRFVPPSYALDDIAKLPRYRSISTDKYGCRLWWVEYGGRLDTVHDTEAIKWELWKVIYGIWNHIKNSGEFPEAETMTLEWVGTIPGKRESRRFEGPYMLREGDIVRQRRFDDAVAYGGWYLDLHPADGVYATNLQHGARGHVKGLYQIPYRCFHSRNLRNLFLAGRIISCSHVAFGATRVIATCAVGGQAVGMAAALCTRENLLPADLSEPSHVRRLQRELMRVNHHIPGLHLDDPEDLVTQAEISASSRLQLAQLPADGPAILLDNSLAQMLPVPAGRLPRVTFRVDVAQSTTLRLEVRTSSRPDNHTPDVTLAVREYQLEVGDDQAVVADFEVDLDEARYLFFCLMQNEHVRIHCSEQRITGLLRVAYKETQSPPPDISVETFEIWPAERRPGGYNFAFQIEPPLDLFAPHNVANGLYRPTRQPNAWLAAPTDPRPRLQLSWPQPQRIAQIDLHFDTDYDHPLESVMQGHPERAIPFCVRHYRLLDCTERVLHEERENHQSFNRIRFAQPVETAGLKIELIASHGEVPAALFGVRCYEREA